MGLTSGFFDTITELNGFPSVVAVSTFYRRIKIREAQMKIVTKKTNKNMVKKCSMVIIKKGYNIENTANIYSCCRKSQREEVV